MNGDAAAKWSDQLTAPPLTPQRVRATHFSRTPLGRRGLSEEEVLDFLEQVAEEIARRDRSEASARESAARAKSALRDWSIEQAGAAPSAGPRPGQGQAVAAVRPPPELVSMMSQAQQNCDRYIKETEIYCRRLAEQAEQHAASIIEEARRQATEAAEQAAHDYRVGVGVDYTSEGEDLLRRLAWMRTFIDALDTVGSQLSTTRDALRYELDKLDPRAADRQRA